MLHITIKLGKKEFDCNGVRSFNYCKRNLWIFFDESNTQVKDYTFAANELILAYYIPDAKVISAYVCELDSSYTDNDAWQAMK